MFCALDEQQLELFVCAHHESDCRFARAVVTLCSFGCVMLEEAAKPGEPFVVHALLQTEGKAWLASAGANAGKLCGFRLRHLGCSRGCRAFRSRINFSYYTLLDALELIALNT